MQTYEHRGGRRLLPWAGVLAGVFLVVATTRAAEFIPGDVNDDGVFDVGDASVLRRALADLRPGVTQMCLMQLPATGQMTNYVPGDDGEIQAGAALAYSDNGDGTITDHNTGLMWEAKSDDGSLHDKDNVFTWTPGLGSIWEWIAAINSEDGIGFAGHDDWRIPNVRELESILDYGKSQPTVPSAFNNECPAGCSVTSCSCASQSAAAYYWSSTTAVGNPTNVAWYVDFAAGGARQTAVNKSTSPLWVRAVRGGPPVCGDDVVNQSSEECDNLDDAACPGRCQSDCTCTSLQWWETCGAPVCPVVCELPPSLRTCTDEQAGAPCVGNGDLCDAGFGCCAVLVCADEDPRSSGCPISRAEHKVNIRYLDGTTRRSIHDEVVRMRLATYNYAEPLADGRTHLGFMIDDNPMSPAVLPSGERVDLYGFTSMAVATLQVQAEQIDAMAAKLAELEYMLAQEHSEARICEP